MQRLFQNEKLAVAGISVGAAIFLTCMKLVVGLLTNSLGVLSEALHSGLDLVAAVVTYFGVRSAAVPADETHQFGHGKIENLSALFETLLLLVTCVWIIWEAIMRLFFREAPITQTTIGIMVMAISIIIDFWRSRALSKAAKKYNSQALAADALHFSSDILSSSVVIVGLICVTIGFPEGDALAALGVAAVVIIVSLRLGKKSIDELMDLAPEGIAKEIKEIVENVSGVERCTRVRSRQVGAVIFADITVLIDGHLPTLSSHHIANTIESRLKEQLQKALDIVIHVEPTNIRSIPLTKQLQELSSQISEIKGIHNVRTWKIGKDTFIDLHFEMKGNLSLGKAHTAADRFEKLLKAQVGEKVILESHLEPVSEHTSIHLDDLEIAKITRSIIEKYPAEDCHQITIKLDELTGKKSLSLHCCLPEEMSLKEVHAISTEIEIEIRRQIDDLAEVTIHIEPKRNGNR
ncbi:MAG: cation-efflux pump [Candidatus Hermodarchaeota archaeon]